MIQSIERAFDILQSVQRQPDGVAIGEVAARTELHVSTVSRIVSTLEHVGALERVGGRLFIGEQIVALANRAPFTERLITIAMPCLRELAVATGEAVGLAEIDRAEAHVFYQIPSMHMVQIRDWTGERFPLHVTSTGKLFLAQLSAEAVVPFLQQPMERMAEGTVVDSAELAAEFPQIRTAGVAWTLDELEDGLTSVAAPIFDRENQFAAGLYVSIPTYRLGDKTVLAQQVRKTAQSISKQL